MTLPLVGHKMGTSRPAESELRPTTWHGIHFRPVDQVSGLR